MTLLVNTKTKTDSNVQNFKHFACLAVCSILLMFGVLIVPIAIFASSSTEDESWMPESTPVGTPEMNFSAYPGIFPCGLSQNAGKPIFVWGTVVTDTPPPPSLSKHTFVGWQDRNSNPVTFPLTITDPSLVVLTAIWRTNFMIFFDGYPGLWEGGWSGVGSEIHHLGHQVPNPPAFPVRSGYIFSGWQYGNNNQISMPYTITDSSMFTENLLFPDSYVWHLTAIWTPAPNIEPTPTPYPTPSPTPYVTPSPSPNPTPYATPSPSPEPTPYTTPSPSPSPTPSPIPSPTPTSTPPIAGAPNPQTSPLQPSFAIFAAVILGGLTILALFMLAKKHHAAINQFEADTARYNREERVNDLASYAMDKNDRSN